MMELLAQTDDTELMRLSAAGSDTAFEELIRRYQDRLFGYFRHCGTTPADAEDLAQEVFIKIHRGAGAYRPTARFSTYLYAVARNCWIDFIRRCHRRPQTVGLNEELLDTHSGDGSDHAAQTGELEKNFQEVLAGLPDKQREVLLLSEAQGLRYAEIAEVLEIPLGTVKSRVFNAIKVLREGMQRRGFYSRMTGQSNRSQTEDEDSDNE